ncbi:ATP-dependent helicase [Kamptonema formosum]|uniref:ATP-dependent helicase n=1 Tax=Kamptonema formosum TaxID=331992 RepID=UPI000360772C|nr:ATP-dependent helicase [Oscillatoria sp. PCC 10802]
MPKDSDRNGTPPEAESLSPAALREAALRSIRDGLRSGQQQMADWQGGPLAVSAVPGAGKSTGMAAAAALAIARHHLHPRRQLVVVTFTRAAAHNIKKKIRQYLERLSLPQLGFSVHTLHGLALNIALRHQDLSGLSLDSTALVTPNQSHRLVRTCVEQWVACLPRRYQMLVQGGQFDGEETERLRRQSVLRTDVLPNLALTVIHEAKSSGLQAQQLRELSELARDEYEILAIAAGLYENYEKLLRSRQFIDYDDMILAALRVLENPTARRLEQAKVFAVFEDEAQDSTPLQSKLLEILATDPAQPHLPPNLIRVGDPNQAINSTFTPADPVYFRKFCKDCDERGMLATMDRAGRSNQIIIDAANFVLEWVNQQWLAGSGNLPLKPPPHGESEERGARGARGASAANRETPFREQKIRAVDSGDPQPDANPDKVGRGLEIYAPRDIFQTAQLMGKRVIELFEEDPDRSAAVLVRENRQGEWLAGEIRRLYPDRIRIYEVGQQERRSHVPAEIVAVLQFLDRPHSPDYLKAALTVLANRKLIPAQDLDALAILPEQFLYPGPLAQPQPEPVLLARRFCSSLLRARLELPIYNLISFVALALNYDQAELATADKLAERVAQQTVGKNSMSGLLAVLSEIVSSERFEPVDPDEAESIYIRAGQLTIITMHKAKGLDWDYVFLPFLHEQTIPGRLWVPPQMQFLGEFTLAEVARAQIRASLHEQYPLPDVGAAWEQAGYLKTAEEYRLLYVAMTRAKRLLWVSAAQQAPFTWNKPNNLQEQKPCPVVPALKSRFPESVVFVPAMLR